MSKTNKKEYENKMRNGLNPMRNTRFYGLNHGKAMRNALLYFISHGVICLIHR